MKVNANDMTTAEWEIMRIIWTKGQANSTEIIKVIQAEKDWSDSTVKTLLRRLVSKAYLRTTSDGRRFIYTPLVAEGDAMQQITNNVFANICTMQQGAVLTNLLEQVTLSQVDIANMQAVLAKKVTTAPVSVACNCISHANCEPMCTHNQN